MNKVTGKHGKFVDALFKEVWSGAPDRDVMEDLLKNKGTNPNVKSSRHMNYTPLLYAARWGHVAAVKLLLTYGADPDIQGPYKYTALHWAAEKGFVEIAEILLQHDAHPNIVAVGIMHRHTPAGKAAGRGHTKILKMIVETCRKKNISIDLDELFILAAKGGHIETLQYLLDCGVSINARNEYGTTALMAATLAGHEPAIKLLTDLGADKTLKDNMGQDASDHAKTRITELAYRAQKATEIKNNQPSF